jgi:hypothetical protein
VTFFLMDCQKSRLRENLCSCVVSAKGQASREVQNGMPFLPHQSLTLRVRCHTRAFDVFIVRYSPSGLWDGAGLQMYESTLPSHFFHRDPPDLVDHLLPRGLLRNLSDGGK